MTRKSLIVKEHHKIKMVAKYQEKRDSLRKILKDINASQKEKLQAQFKMQNLPILSCKVRMRNRCNVTGRSGGFIRRYGLARQEFREQALKGNIPGVKKASW